MRVLAIAQEGVPIERAIHRSGSLLALARRERAIVVMAQAIEPGSAIVLGRLQHAGRVLDAAALAERRVLRRSTTGTGFAIDGGLVITIALPYVDAAFPDATPRTFLNRNVRPIMKGFEHAGAAVSYFGREWLASRRERGRAVAMLAADVEADGALVVEAWATRDGSLAIPEHAVTPIERSCDRFRGRAPMSLSQLGAREIDVERVVRGMVERLGFAEKWAPADAIPLERDRGAASVTDPSSPNDLRAEVLAPRAVPIGYLDVALLDREVWIGGDVLGPSFALGTYASWNDPTLPMEGALWDDVRRAYDMAQHHARAASR